MVEALAFRVHKKVVCPQEAQPRDSYADVGDDERPRDRRVRGKGDSQRRGTVRRDGCRISSEEVLRR